MYVNPFQVSIDTLIGASPILGHGLEDRGDIRNRQDHTLLQYFQSASTTPLRHAEQQEWFCVAPFDILAADTAAGKRFHLLEINGTGIGGLTNVTGDAVSAVLDSLCEWAQRFPEPDALIIVASSGKEVDADPRLNRLLHEKILYAEALKRGFEYAGRSPKVITVGQLEQQPKGALAHRPLVVLGYMKDFLDHLRLEHGRLFLAGRPVHGAVNDRFCSNVLHYFHHEVDLQHFRTLNRCFLAGADKGVTYGLLADFLDRHHMPYMMPVDFAMADDRAGLLEIVIGWVRRGRRTVIKPRGAGAGHGIEFFLNAVEPLASIEEKIDRSLRLTEEYYRLKGGAFPYTVCNYVDSCRISRADHPLCGHRYELRVAVYRDGPNLKAYPGITKISSERYDAANPSYLSLINNITASTQATKAHGTEFMQPLTNRETLELLDLSADQLRDLCTFATRFTRFILDEVHDAPARLGLPATTATPLPHRVVDEERVKTMG